MQQDTILIVDPDDTTRATLAAALLSAGHGSGEVIDAAAALRYLQVRPGCQLVLANVDLPETDGIALLDSISQEHPEIPVILFSRKTPTEKSTEAFRHGVFDFLPMPCDDNLLVATAAAAIEHGRMRRQSLAYRQNLEELIDKRTGKLRDAMSDLERSYDVTLEAMGDALDLRDAETEGHSKRVTAYTIALARAMRVPSAELKFIARGAYLHDIGKIAIPDAILLKPGKLTPDETLIMREHCQRGYEMVRKIPFLLEAAEIVHAHQEKFDGTGYPRGLQGDVIPLGARIFAIADALDAITSDRPYRKGTSFQHAREEIERCSGAQFDPEIVMAFLALPRGLWSDIRAEVGKNSHCAEVLRSAAA